MLNNGTPILPEIMVPQVITVQELIKVKSYVDQIQQEVESQYGIALEFKFGTMVETVRACTRAGELAQVAEFFSFGTNDLTQATFSFSREDAENKFLPLYNEIGLLEDNPFEVLDAKGVGQLMKMTADSGRKTRPDIINRHLRRTRRTSAIDSLLSSYQTELCLLFGATYTHRQAGCSPCEIAGG